ncbi:F-box/kelch-repeat protein At3g06240-like [Mangifera indica]|uniref:F-box/kelch-repeat protein At3g06240-like n=1 Tax=Mangifera indica TaxID=29780 RepID=UPI001CFA7DBF|nr:F-box/kelch-repeat protein At3g06240-like [Mangifera indica]
MGTTNSQWEELMKNTMSQNLPNEIVIDILSRLPVKSIVKFKCVSKPWRSLFSDPKFIELHLNRAIAKNSHCLLVRHVVDPDEKIYSKWNKALLGDIDRLEVPLQNKGNNYLTVKSGNSMICVGRYRDHEEIYSLRNSETSEDFARLEVPGQSITNYFSIVGCGSGLVCLNEANFNGSYHSLNSFFWNPATREFRALPRYFINRFTSSLVVVGLGFAFVPMTNDYKVVRILYFIESKVHEVEVFSLNTDCWSKVDADIQCNITSQLSQAYVNGSLHWMATKRDDDGNTHYSIFSFNMVEETFGMLMLPKCCEKDLFPSHKLLTMFAGSLVVFVFNPYQLNKSCDMWVMKEYGVAKSWTKTFSIVNEVEVMIPLGIFDNGEIIMEKEKDGELYSFDPRAKQGKSLSLYQPARIVKYIESLVSPQGRDRIAGSVSAPSTSQVEAGSV